MRTYNYFKMIRIRYGIVAEIDVMSVLPVLVIAIVLSIVSYFLREGRTSSFATAEFSDSDEREALITGKATRAAYVAFMISLPVLMIAFLFEQPLLQLYPAFPFYAIALVLSIGTLTYMSAWIVHVRR